MAAHALVIGGTRFIGRHAVSVALVRTHGGPEIVVTRAPDW